MRAERLGSYSMAATFAGIPSFSDLNRHPNFETDRLKDVALLAIGIVQQSDASGAIGIVFDGRYLRGDSQFFRSESSSQLRDRPAEGCSASRHRHSAAKRCERSDWDRIRWPLP